MSATELFKTTLFNVSTLKAYYRLEGNSNDATANGFNGTDTAISYAAALFGQGATFNGSTSLIAANSAKVADGSAFTLSAWFKTTSTTEGCLVSNGRSSSDNPFASIRINYSGTNSRLAFECRDDASTIVTVSYSPGSGVLNDGAWHHVAGIKRSASSWQLWVDGLLVATASTTLGTTTIDRVSVGALTRSSSVFFYNGDLDDVSMFSSAISAEDVKTLYSGRMVGEIWPQANLNALYHLDGQSNDYSGNASTGTDTSVTYSLGNGRFGKGGSFNGTSSKIVFTDSSTFKPTGNLTMMAWINTASSSGNQSIFYSFSQNTNLAGIRLRVGPTTATVSFSSARNTGTTVGTDVQTTQGTTTVNDSKWHHVVGVWDGTNIYVYLDGRLENSAAWSNAPGYAATNYVRIGCRSNSGTDVEFFDGKIDEVALFSRAWSAQEIRRYYAWASGKIQAIE